MLSELRTGLITSADGSVNPQRADRTGSLITADGHARYMEAVFRRTVYNGGIVSQTTTVGLATTYTGLVLSNPVGSPVNLVLNKCGYAFTVAFAAVAAIGLMTGFNASTNVTHTTPVTPRSQFFNSAGGGVGLLDSAATLPTAPTVNTFFDSATTATAAVPPLPHGIVDMEGSIIIPPGGYVAFFTSAASGAAGGFFSFSWEEVPI